jgi:magnesium chelatase accessory protein
MIQRPRWDREGRDWPHRSSSRFVEAGGLTWHVQVMGAGPVVLLIHGTGSSSHSWRGLVPLLDRHFTLVAPDLPGHAFTSAPPEPIGYALPNVALALSALLKTLDLTPDVAVGHSAGAAIAARMCLDGLIEPRVLVSLNGALLPFPALTNDIVGPAARALAASPIAARTFAFLAGARPSVERMIRSGGSTIDAEGAGLYARLAGNPGHVAGALGLMAHWDLRPLKCDLPSLRTRLVLVTGSQDGMVPPSESRRVRTLVRGAELVTLHGLGHLAHEERPADVAALLQRVAWDQKAEAHAHS